MLIACDMCLENMSTVMVKIPKVIEKHPQTKLKVLFTIMFVLVCPVNVV
jgi:hypothetical protein